MTEAALPRQRAAAPPPEPVVPERPRLAPGVELRGEMTESAFKQPPWLIERDGTFIPVSEILHAVAELADGRRTLAQMAEDLSERIQRAVTADDVEILLGNLIKSGIIATADGQAHPGAQALQAAGPSPLTINMRMKMLPAGVIDAGSRVLQVLFWPPILLTVLAIGAAAQAWMYFVHGIGGSLHEALYAPGFVLLVLAAIVVAAGFHEFGHAAALRYAGGRARTMGVGIYLFYPAFYTDVTDNYRLPRWSRLRTDLGGFYFHLIFALAVIGIYLVVGWEPLLLIVVLINLEIVHQLMPFVRLDGYWTLADMTGIPDFFTHMKPFLRSLLPVKAWRSSAKVPELKTWAKVVFILYILVTIPVLLFVLVQMVVGLPRILGTAWDSLGQQWESVQTAIGAGDGLTVAGSVVQMLVLVAVTGGLLFFLFSLARTLFRKGWEWSRPTWPRRLIGAGATVALAAVLLLLFAPSAPIVGTRGPLAGAIDFRPIGPDEPLRMQDMTRQLSGGGLTTSDDAGSPLDPVDADASATPTSTPAASDGAVQPTATPGDAVSTPTPTPPPAETTPVPTASAEPEPTPTPTALPSPTPSPTPTPVPAP